MFNNFQHIDKMTYLKKIPVWVNLLLAIVFISSCSSVGDLPTDDLYYARKAKNPSEYNWNDFQKNAQSYNTGQKSGSTNNGTDSFSNESNPEEHVGSGAVYAGAANSQDISTTVKSGEELGGDNQYIDEYYDGEYSDRVSRFGTNSEESGFGYYDGYNSNSGCNCNNSGWSMSVGMGVGMGMGYGSSFMAGYNMGYSNGYMNSYYGYPYYPYDPFYGGGGYYGGGGGYYGGGGGYYGEQVFAKTYYGPRGGGNGGSTIPKYRGTTQSDRGDDEGKKQGTVVVSRGGGGSDGYSRSAGVYGSTTAAQGNSSIRTGNSSTISTNPPEYSRGNSAEIQNQEKLTRPSTNKTTTTREGNTYNRQDPKYKKPKSYERVSAQQPRSSKEYVRPTSTKRVSTKSNSNPYVRTKTQTSRSSGSGHYSRGSYNNSSKSYSSPSRSSGSQSSYSSPSHSSGSSGSSISRSSGTGSRSSGSSGGSSRSSSSSSGGSRSVSKR